MSNPNHEMDRVIRSMMMKDLRQELRSRGLSPAGSQESLQERLKDDMVKTGVLELKSGSSNVLSHEIGVPQAPPLSAGKANDGPRPFGTDEDVGVPEPPRKPTEPLPAFQRSSENTVLAPPEEASGLSQGGNNYSRPSGQNVGNFLTDRNSSRVLAPPGGKSSISFGE